MNNSQYPSNIEISVPDITSPLTLTNATTFCKLISQIITIYQQTRTIRSAEIKHSQQLLAQMETQMKATSQAAIVKTNIMLYTQCREYLNMISSSCSSPDVIEFGLEELRILSGHLHSIAREFS